MERMWGISQNPTEGSISVPGEDRNGSWLRLSGSILCLSVLPASLSPWQSSLLCLPLSLLFPYNSGVPWHHLEPSCIAVFFYRIQYCLITVSRENPTNSHLLISCPWVRWSYLSQTASVKRICGGRGGDMWFVGFLLPKEGVGQQSKLGKIQWNSALLP